MKIRSIIGIAIGTIIGILLMPAVVGAQVSSSPWKVLSNTIQPTISSWALKVPALGAVGNPCLTVDSSGNVSTQTCGSGGSGGGTWSTTTSSVPGHLINYPNNNTDIVTVGGNSTSTASFIFDPNSLIGYVKTYLGINTKSPNYNLEVNGTASTSVLNIGTLTGPLQAINGLVSVAPLGTLFSTTSANYWGSQQGYLTSVSANSPLGGSGTSGSPLTCSTCNTTNASVSSIGTNNGLTGGTITTTGTVGLDTSLLSTNLITAWSGSKLEATGTPNLTAAYFTATSSINASALPYASTTDLSVSNLTNGNCVQAGTNGELVSAASACGSGGGSAGGTWASTTSQTPNHAINYSFSNGSASTDVVAIGGTSTSTSKFYFDPNTGFAGITTSHVGIKVPVTFTVCSSETRGGTACDYQATSSMQDMGAVINTALNACPTTGCHIQLLEGHYQIGTSINFPANRVWISGAGASSTVLVGTAALGNTAIFEVIASAGNPRNNITISDMAADGGSMSRVGYSSGRKFVYMQYVTHLTIQNTYAYNFPATCYGADYVSAYIITNNVFSACGTAGQADNGGSNGIGMGTIGLITFGGLSSTTPEPSIIANNIGYNTANKCIMVEGQPNNTGASNVIMANNICIGGKIGYGIAGTTHVTMIGDQAYLNSSHGVEILAASYYPTVASAAVNITGGDYSENGGYGIYSPDASTSDVTVNGATIQNNTSGGIFSGSDNTTIESNTVKLSGNNGITITVAAGQTIHNLVVQNNVVTNNGTTSSAGNNEGIQLNVPSGTSLLGAAIDGNYTNDSQSSQTQSYGLDFEGSGTYTNIEATQNNLIGNIHNTILNTSAVATTYFFNNPGDTHNTITGGLTVTGLGGSGTSCLQTSNTGVVSATGSACGSGGGGGTGAGWASTTADVNSIYSIATHNLGVATSTPVAALDVYGQIFSEEQVLATSTGTATLPLTNAQNAAGAFLNWRTSPGNSNLTITVSNLFPGAGTNLMDCAPNTGQIGTTSIAVSGGAVIHMGTWIGTTLIASTTMTNGVCDKLVMYTTAGTSTPLGTGPMILHVDVAANQ